MRSVWQSFVTFFVSLRLTVALLVLSMFLVFAATLDQQNLGVWGIQQKWFHSWVVMHTVNDRLAVPVYPGGYFLGTLLLINLISAHIYRFKLTWHKAGIFLTHLGLILLLIGELLTGIWQKEFQMRLEEGTSVNYAESPQATELALVDASDPQWDDVIAIPDSRLAPDRSLQHPKLPFRVVVKDYYPNSTRPVANAQASTMPASPATQGLGTRMAVSPLPLTYKQDERNFPSAFIELVTESGSLGTWFVSTHLAEAQAFTAGGKPWLIALRPTRLYKPYSLALLKFSHDKYAGTDIPKNFSSKIRIETSNHRTDREVLIYMNNPLRYDGLTFYQASFDPQNPRATILQVVRNPSWTLPYIACAMMFTGLVSQFLMSLFKFMGKRSAAVSPPAAA
jgi:hypothetical protein